MSGSNAELVDAGDLDELTRQVDRLCALRDWDGVLDLRDRCRRAFERGRQLWPVATHAEYRVALEAPGPWAASVLEPGAGRFALGPLTEVAASTHTWAELSPHGGEGPMLSLAGHERVVRGEDLTGDRRLDPWVLELPPRLQPWEPAYPLAVYRPSEARFPEAPAPELSWTEVTPTVAPDGASGGDPGAEALTDLVATWVGESNGRARAVRSAGDAVEALGALGVPHAGLAPLSPPAAMASMAWAAASGGAHGRRQGMATGRFSAWWAVASLAGVSDTSPLPPEAVGESLAELGWYRWRAAEPEAGWVLRLVVEDRRSATAWALDASDRA